MFFKMPIVEQHLHKYIADFVKKTPFVYHTLKCVVCFGFSGCSEIKTPRLHPLTKVSGLISDINKYFELIKPFLEEGDIETAKAGIIDIYFRANKAFENTFGWKNGTYERYVSAIQKLKALADSKISSKRVLDSILSMINRDVMELEFILQGDEIYEKYREKEEVV